jgi:hypothetical protein
VAYAPEPRSGRGLRPGQREKEQGGSWSFFFSQKSDILKTNLKQGAKVVTHTTNRFDAVDIDQLRLLGKLSSGQRIRAMLDARELAVGLIRGRLRQRYPDLSLRAINMKLIEEVTRGK